MELDQIRRKLTALENKQRVNVANTAGEAKALKNEGSVLKASSGVITSNVVIKAPNIPDDLQQKVKSIDELNKKVETNTTNIATNADDIDKLESALSSLESSLKNLNIPSVDGILQAIKDIQYIMTSSLTSFASMKHVHEVQDELVNKIEELTTLVNTISTNDSSQDTKITALETTVKNKADSSHTHTTFSNAITVNDKSQTTSYPLSVFNDSINENQSMIIGLGRCRDNSQCAKIEYYYSTSDPYLQLSLYNGGGKIRIYNNKIEFNSVITSQNSITAWDVRTKDNISLYDTYTKVNSLSTSFTEVKSTAESASDTATAASGKVEEMEQTISSLENSCNNLESTTSTIQISLSALEQDNSNINSTLTEVETTATSAYEKVTDIEGSITTLEQDIVAIKSEILQTLYPVGSIYTSMNSTTPDTVFGFGTWTQITDRFLYCADSSKETGGNKTHCHEYGIKLPIYYGALCNNDDFTGTTLYDGSSWTYTKRGRHSNDIKTKVRSGTNAEQGTVAAGYVIGNTGEGSSLPPFITCYAWYRTA